MQLKKLYRFVPTFDNIYEKYLSLSNHYYRNKVLELMY